MERRERNVPPLRLMRGACPCAACGGEPDVMGNLVRPEVHYTPQSFDLTRLANGRRLCPPADLGRWP